MIGRLGLESSTIVTESMVQEKASLLKAILMASHG